MSKIVENRACALNIDNLLMFFVIARNYRSTGTFAYTLCDIHIHCVIYPS